MKTHWYVIGPDKLTSWSGEKDEAESFASMDKAIARAKKLAEMQPGETFFVCQTVRGVVADVKPVSVAQLP